MTPPSRAESMPEPWMAEAARAWYVNGDPSVDAECDFMELAKLFARHRPAPAGELDPGALAAWLVSHGYVMAELVDVGHDIAHPFTLEAAGIGDALREAFKALRTAPGGEAKAIPPMSTRCTRCSAVFPEWEEHDCPTTETKP